jgi:predicted small integral membrane protein
MIRLFPFFAVCMVGLLMVSVFALFFGAVVASFMLMVVAVWFSVWSLRLWSRLQSCFRWLLARCSVLFSYSICGFFVFSRIFCVL